MGREVRKVPPSWHHPKTEGYSDRYQPMYDESYASAVAKWKAGYAKWEAEGKTATEKCEFWEWEGMPPEPEYYRPEWTDEERTHLQMYETTSEGTPISPVMETPEQLARWLADNKASAFGGMTATYEQWLATIHAGYAPSGVYTPETGLISGVAAAELK